MTTNFIRRFILVFLHWCCRRGLHIWSKWSEPQQYNFIGEECYIQTRCCIIHGCGYVMTRPTEQKPKTREELRAEECKDIITRLREIQYAEDPDLDY